MSAYLSIACKLLINVHDLNNEGSVGQALDIRQIRMVGEDGKELPEMPAVSGRMMKHWHLAHMQRTELEIKENRKLCGDCKVMEPQREPGKEDNALKNCIICDVHGYLQAKEKEAGSNEDNEKSESKKSVVPRRSSCVMFSWLLPVLNTDQTAKQVIHNRVESPAGDKRSMMPFHKTYASGTYAFVCSIDLGRIGKPLSGDEVIKKEEIQRRQKIAVQSLLPLCLGAFGASQSHALPHTRCLGLLAGLSTTEKPIPNLISPIYTNGFKESVLLLKKAGEKVFGYGEIPELNDSEKKTTVQDVFEEIIKQI